MEPASGGDTHSELSGSAADVVQARDIAGGIHFHRPAPAYPLPRQLPRDVAGFVDRQDEMRRLDAALAPGGHSLALVVGSPGVGKTSLTLHWAHRVRDRFPDGQLYVNLHGYGPGTPLTPLRALESLLTSLGVPPAQIPQAEDDCAALYRSLLADRRMLILLDDVATVPQIRPLLPGTPECLVLATSRGQLSGLVVRDGAYRLTLGLLTEADAVELLRTVMGQRRGDDPARLAELARLCAWLPLALRIAGERAVSHPWLPLDDSYEACGPVRGRFKAVNLSASGSHLFVIGAHGDMFTRLYDFDISGHDPVFFEYSYEDQRGRGDGAPIQLPAEPWKRQPKIPGTITDRISIHKVGADAVHGILRVEGRHKGRTGYWERDLAAPPRTPWRFHATGQPLQGRVLDNPRRDTVRRSLGRGEESRWVMRQDGTTAELRRFNTYCSPATLIVHERNGRTWRATLHHVDGLRQQPRGRGLDDEPREQYGAIERNGRFETVTLRATRHEIVIPERGWRFTPAR